MMPLKSSLLNNQESANSLPIDTTQLRFFNTPTISLIAMEAVLAQLPENLRFLALTTPPNINQSVLARLPENLRSPDQTTTNYI